ncbi:MAG: hypothetical protein OXI69_00245 [Acidobacteriota bacterium]|nr:hypothetical protein [Acidobacteriota bacterium]
MKKLRATEHMPENISDELEGVLCAYEELLCGILYLLPTFSPLDPLRGIRVVNLDLTTSEYERRSSAFRSGIEMVAEAIDKRVKAMPSGIVYSVKLLPKSTQ